MFDILSVVLNTLRRSLKKQKSRIKRGFGRLEDSPKVHKDLTHEKTSVWALWRERRFCLNLSIKLLEAVN